MMTSQLAWHVGAAFALLAAALDPAWAAGDAAHGAAVFQVCRPCHSTTAGEQMTGPSLAHVWHRKAGTLEGFDRYSEAMKHANVTWNEETLERWLANPGAFIHGTTMTFPGIRDAQALQDVIAYLESVSEGKAPAAVQGGMMRGMQASRKDLKQAPPEGQVTALDHCHETYTVKTADGKTNKVWEFNLRLKTDSSPLGPRPGKPVIVGSGMQGDRASVVFATPAEISRFIKESCG